MPIDWVEHFRAAAPPDGHRPLIAALATTARDGSPRARSIVIREIGEDGALWFVADSRGEKLDQLLADPRAEIVVWLAEPRAQYRFRGAAHRVPHDEAALRQKFWRRLTDASRAMYFWPEPGEIRAKDAEFVESINDAVAIPPTFEVFSFAPNDVECLEVKTVPHRRRRWRAQAQWIGQELNP